MTLAPGTRLGAYQILSPLGAGGMGEVYRARDTRLGRDIAIRILPPASPTHAAPRMGGIGHPNLATVFSVETEAGARFLTMELVDGVPLARIIPSGGMALARLLDIAIPTADAIVDVHEGGLVHQDLHPGTIVVTSDHQVKVLDFSLAGSSAPAPYRSPEQIRAEAVDARSDVFAFGVILYELAVGRRPFSGSTPEEVTRSVLRDEPAPLAGLRPDLPATLVNVIERCLAKHPEERFGTMLEVCHELRRMRSLHEHGVRLMPAQETDDVASIAVLPFVNASASKDDAYFSDGLADELLNTLLKIRRLRVAARTSSFQFRDPKEDITTIGRKLRVDTLLEGSVRKAGNRVRILVQLIKVADGLSLWSETYDRTLDDIFAVQDDIAQCVVRELRTALLGKEADPTTNGDVRAEVAHAARGRASKAEAHHLQLRARHLILHGGRDDVFLGIEYLERALELDPGFARGWAELANAHHLRVNMGWVPRTSGFARAREAVEHALRLEPTLAEGHARLARIRMSYDWDWRGAEVSYAIALEHAPGSPVVLLGAMVLMQTLGRFEEAMAFAEKALRRDPVDCAVYMSLGLTLDAAGRLADAEAAYRQALAFAPQRINLRAHLAMALLDQHRVEEAIEIAREELDEGYRLWALAIIHAVTGERGLSDDALRVLIENYAGDAAFQIAEVHAIRGETDLAFAWLDRAYVQRDSGLVELNVRRSLRSLHGDPRWAPLQRKMGFTT